jgi:hypothetical protein
MMWLVSSIGLAGVFSVGELRLRSKGRGDCGIYKIAKNNSRGRRRRTREFQTVGI